MSIRVACFIFTLLSLSQVALAGLGGPATPTSTGHSSAKAMQRPTNIDHYTVSEIQTPVGGIIKEYVSAQGIVFAITWQSPIMPDLHELLGSYFPAFERAAADSRSSGRRGPLSIVQSDLVVQSGGQMRNFRGRAYVPSLLPPNVAADEIQ